MLSLKALLLGLTVFVRFLLEHLLLVFVAILCFVELDLNSDEITLHSLNHVLVGPLNHHLVFVRVFNRVQSVFRVMQTVRLAEACILNRSFFILGLLQFSLSDEYRCR